METSPTIDPESQKAWALNTEKLITLQFCNPFLLSARYIGFSLNIRKISNLSFGPETVQTRSPLQNPTTYSIKSPKSFGLVFTIFPFMINLSVLLFNRYDKHTWLLNQAPPLILRNAMQLYIGAFGSFIHWSYKCFSLSLIRAYDSTFGNIYLLIWCV